MTTHVRRLSRGLTAACSVGAAMACVHAAWNVHKLVQPRSSPRECREQVAILVPARNEASTLGQCLASLRNQTHCENLHIVVLDDNSTDPTPQIMRAHEASDERVTCIDAQGEPPKGWLGKSWACQQLADTAPAQDCDVLVFVDADVNLAPHAIASAVEVLRDRNLQLISPYPRQLAESLCERLTQPLLQWSWLSFLPLATAESSPDPSLAAANGQFLVVDQAAYRAISGHASVASVVLEDVGLLRAIKRNGGKGVVIDGTSLAQCRMYQDWPQLREGYRKWLWSAFGTTTGSVGVGVAAFALYVVPAVAALFGSRIGAAGYAAGVLGRVITGRRTGARVWPDTLAHPASIVLFDVLLFSSVRGRRNGTLRWKDRVLPPITALGDHLERL